jgi:hypothetical protein
MSVPEAHLFLTKLDEPPTYYNRLVYDAAQCEREGKSIPNYSWYLCKLVWDAEQLPDCDWCSQELVQTALDRYLPIPELTVPWFKEVAALEGKLLTAPYHNEKIAAIKSRPRSANTSHPAPIPRFTCRIVSTVYFVK